MVSRRAGPEPLSSDLGRRLQSSILPSLRSHMHLFIEWWLRQEVLNGLFFLQENARLGSRRINEGRQLRDYRFKRRRLR